MTSHRLAIPGVVCLNAFSSLRWAQPLGREQWAIGTFEIEPPLEMEQ